MAQNAATVVDLYRSVLTDLGAEARILGEAAMLREVELKLEVSPSDLSTVHEVAGRAGTAEPSKTLQSTYFDTRNKKLRKAGLSLRVRRDAARIIQTVKADRGTAAGLYDRAEWEHEIQSEVPVLGDVAGPVGRVLKGRDAKRLVPVVISAIERTTVHAAVNDSQVEIAIDHGEIHGGEQSAPLCEVELELKSGGPAALFALARQLDAVAPVRLGVLTKADRGFRLLEQGTAPVARASQIELDPAMTAAAAFQTIAWSCIQHYRLNETLAAADPAALHQARVALRRLRSAFSLFKQVVADARSDHLRGELRWLSSVLGEARNLDVLIPKVDDPALLVRLHTAREKAYGEATTATASVRARSMMLDLAEWLTLGSWLAGPAGRGQDLAVEEFATGVLERFRRRVKHLGAKLAAVDDERRHELRIEAKKLRYATEFFASLFDDKKLRRKRERFRRKLESLQEELGTLNDMATAPLVLAMLGEPASDTAKTDVVRQTDLLLAAEASHTALLKTGRFWSRQSGK